MKIEAQDIMRECAAADYLQVSKRTLQAWRVKGGGPCFLKLGRAVRYERKALDAYVAARRYKNTAATSGS